MTQNQIDQYNIRYEIEHYLCPHGSRAIGIAHRIAATKCNYKKYGKEKIDHNYNLVPYCNLECNDSFNIGMKPYKCNKLLKLIYSCENELLTVQKINEIIYE